MNINRVSQKVSSGIPKFAQKIISELVEGGVPDGLVRSELNPTISKSGWELVSRARVKVRLDENSDRDEALGQRGVVREDRAVTKFVSVGPKLLDAVTDFGGEGQCHTVLYVNTDGNRVHGIKLYKVDDQVRVHSVVDSKDGTQGYLVSGKLAEFR